MQVPQEAHARTVRVCSASLLELSELAGPSRRGAFDATRVQRSRAAASSCAAHLAKHTSVYTEGATCTKREPQAPCRCSRKRTRAPCTENNHTCNETTAGAVQVLQEEAQSYANELEAKMGALRVELDEQRSAAAAAEAAHAAAQQASDCEVCACVWPLL